MMIENAQVAMYSQTQFQYEHTQETSLQLHYGQRGVNENANANANTNVNANANGKANEAFTLNLQYSYTENISVQRVAYDYEENMSLEDKIKKQLLELLLQRLYGDKPHIAMYPQKKGVELQEAKNTNTQPIVNPYKEVQGPQELKAMVFQTHEQYYQKQSVDFSASLKIETPNKSFEMNIELSFSKELYESRSTRMVIGDESFIDPLVINYDKDVNPFENISQLRFAFDLDNNGETEMIPLLKQGAGFLALDKNNNGVIDNGHELFGPKTNNGFEELAQYDTDKNNFIDENDDIFNKLKIWSIDDSGNNALVSLVDKNVGAIYLGDVQSGFKYQSAIDQTNAVQKSNGVFIKEDGSGAGVVNSIDVVV